MTATITLAVALGTLAATSAYYRSETASKQPLLLGDYVQAAVSADYDENSTTENTDINDSSVVNDQEADDGLAETNTPPAKRLNRTRARRAPMTLHSVPEVPVTASANAPEEQPVPRRVSRWEERRARRAARRNRDLFRIDEIFEGSPTP